MCVFTSDYWPLPRKISTSNDIFTWFVQLTGVEPSEDFTCLTSEEKPERGKLTDMEEHLLNDTYQAPSNYPALLWEARWKFADHLNRYTELRTLNENTEQYYENTYNETYTRLNAIYSEYLNRWKPANSLTADVENASVALKALLEQRFALNELLSESSEDNASLHNQMMEADVEIETAALNFKNLYITLSDLVDQNVIILLSDLDGIECAEIFESDMKIVLNIMLLSHFTSGTLSSEQTEQIKSIADKCRYSSGYAVVLARAFFEPKLSYEQDINCEIDERSNNKKQENSDIAIYPNPAHQTMTLQITQPFTNAKAKLFNSQGILLNMLEISTKSTNLPINILPNGTYYLDINIDEKLSIHKPFVKI